MKSQYIELEKEFDCPGFTELHVTVGATVHENGDVEGHEAYIGCGKGRVTLTHLFCNCELQGLNEEFIEQYQNEYRESCLN